MITCIFTESLLLKAGRGIDWGKKSGSRSQVAFLTQDPEFFITGLAYSFQMYKINFVYYLFLGILCLSYSNI